MRLSGFAAVALMLFCSAALAAPAGDSTIKELIEVTDMKNVMVGAQNSVRATLDAAMNETIKANMKGRKPNAAQQKAIDRYKERNIAVAQQMLSWEKFEPMMTRLYRETFTEEELAGILAFYKTPAGQAVIRKMPQLMQNMSPEIRKMIADMGPQMNQIQADFEAEMGKAGK